MIGQILGDRYEIQQQLGKKAGRRTLLARDLVTGELVVVKLLSFSSDFEWDDLKLFEREAETLKSLSHPAIPRYLDYFEVNSLNVKGFALIQSYIPAQTLEQYLKTGRTFTEVEIKQVAKALLEILVYLHELHPPVIHRDIKPSNILLGERSGNSIGQVYLVDFGSVQTVLATETGTKTVVGTYDYIPQEQFGGRTVPASDLYSLGGTLIYLVTGSHPSDLPQKDFRIEFEQATQMSPGLTRWLKLMTEPTLEKRWSSAVAALKGLDESQLPNIGALTVSKPFRSKIQLTKDQDYLEIFIPPVGFQPWMVFTGFFAIAAIAWNSFILFGTIPPLSTPFPPPFWSFGSLMLYGFLFSLFGSNHLRIDHQQITCIHELFGFKLHHPRPSPRESISKLIYIPKHSSYDPERRQIEIPARLQIWTRVEKYQFSVNNPIKSEAELEWLAHELSNWLGIAIERE